MVTISRIESSLLGGQNTDAGMPRGLLRFFSQEDYARRFMAGEIRFGLLDHYRKVEGSRRDEKEGKVSFDWNLKAPQLRINKRTGQIIGRTQSDQKIHSSGSSLNPYYILSTSHPEVDTRLLAEKFGTFIVCINDPLALLERINAVWREHSWFLRSAFITPVVYNKDGLVEPDPYLIAPFHYYYSQKPNFHEEEGEFRYVLTCTVDTKRTLPDFLTFRVPDCSDICSLM